MEGERVGSRKEKHYLQRVNRGKEKDHPFTNNSCQHHERITSRYKGK